MHRQPIWMIKTQGAVALFAAALAVLLMLAAPASISGLGEGVSAAPHSASSVQSEPRIVRSPFASSLEPSRSFHTAAQTAPEKSLSSGALGMMLLGLLSVAMLIGAFFFRSTETRTSDDR